VNGLKNWEGGCGAKVQEWARDGKDEGRCWRGGGVGSMINYLLMGDRKGAYGYLPNDAKLVP
jgi:hypothetical protein